MSAASNHTSAVATALPLVLLPPSLLRLWPPLPAPPLPAPAPPPLLLLPLKPRVMLYVAAARLVAPPPRTDVTAIAAAGSCVAAASSLCRAEVKAGTLLLMLA
jgi:hypothetical protein